MERFRKEVGSLVVKSEHINKKMKMQEEKLEKVELEACNTQKAAEELAVRLISQINSGGIEGVNYGSIR